MSLVAGRGHVALLVGLFALGLGCGGPDDLPVHSPSSSYDALDAMPKAPRKTLPSRSEFQKGSVLVKLVPSSGASADSEVLGLVRQVSGVRSTEPVFAEAKPPSGEAMAEAPGGRMYEVPDLTRWHRVDLDERLVVEEALAALEVIPGVRVAEPDYLRKPSIIPGSATDPSFAQQWHLGATNVPQAWAHLQGLGLEPGGDRDVVVAVIDTGVDLTHPDLVANLWTNPADQSHGKDVITGSSVPSDDHGHGTHVAGIIAAQAANGIGGVGVAYNVQVMAIKAAQYSGVLASSHIAQGIYYAVANGADVINMSFGGYGKSSLEEDALAVAFGQAVLVAAAGNDGMPNDAACNPLRWGAMYPAAYDWVLGVMASNPTPTPNGDRLASFSNYDCIPRDSKEYEVMAPGAGIWSTLPGGQHAAWSGTSMATPVVSGIAALVRTKFSDKVTYPSRFIMGQIASTGAAVQAYTPQVQPPVAFKAPDALAALTSVPKPRLSYLESWHFDSASIAAGNDGNGTIDAGETIDLAVVIRNHWGKADNVSVHLEAWADGAVAADPYVTMMTDTVSYGSVGSFNAKDNGLQRDAAGVITGVSSPFRFSVAANAPNGHVIPFRVTLTATNGYDPTDLSSYVTESRFELSVVNGIELPRIVAHDTTLTSDTLWIVRHPVLVPQGVTLTVLPGTTVEFAIGEAASPYSQVELPYIQVEGTFLVQGVEGNPAEMKPSDAGPRCWTFSGYTPQCVGVRIKNYGTTELSYARIVNPFVGLEDSPISGFPAWKASVDRIDHCEFLLENYYTYQGWGIGSNEISGSRFNRLKLDYDAHGRLDSSNVSESLFDGLSYSSWYQSMRLGHVEDSVFLNGLDVALITNWSGLVTTSLSLNAFLNDYNVTDPASWMKLRVASDPGSCSFFGSSPVDARQNYWATTSNFFVDLMLVDFFDDFNCAEIQYQPILLSPPISTFPFVEGVTVANGQGLVVPVVGSEPVSFTVTFNRDMDTTVQPQVSFGPAEPYTDYVVTGAWQSPRVWVGSFEVGPMTGDGQQLIRVAGAVAADDPWLVTGNDKGRFRFEVLTSGSAAMNLQATGGEGYVDLMWTQDDFDLLAGFNLYRATSPSGPFARINTTIIPAQVRTFRDTNVGPGTPYYYQFVVVMTDMTESQPSNVAPATPIDTIPPVISHAPVTTAPPATSLSLSAQVTDNVAVQAVELHFRAIGQVPYVTRPMLRTTGNTYTATIEGAAMSSPGIEYYLSATDGVSIVNSARPEYPYQVAVVDRPVVNAVTPSTGSASGGTSVTIVGTNFKPGASVTFGGAVASNVVVVNGNQITCVTPAHFPAPADVVVSNPGGQSGALLRGFTFESGVASLSLPAITTGQHAIVRIPVNAASVDGLVAADLEVIFDSTVLVPRGAFAGTLTPGWSIAANIATAGRIGVSMASSGGGVVGSGVLVHLEFEVTGAPASSTALTLSSVALNGGAIPSSTAAGSLDVEAVSSVSGAVTYWSAGSAIPGVDLQLAGDRLYAAQTNAAGAFTVQNVATGAYSLRPSKIGGDAGITAFDASLVLRHAAGISLLSGAQAVAADVDKSGVIDSMDAYYVLQRAAGLITLPFPGAGVTWEFTPPVRNYSSVTSNLTGQDFVGILLGDVSGNWSGQESTVLGGAPVSLRVVEWPAQQDGTLTVVLRLSPGAEDAYSLDAVLDFDRTLGRMSTMKIDGTTSDWLAAYNSSHPGQVRISLAGAEPLSSEGVIITITFEMFGDSSELGVVVSDAKVNETVQPDVSYESTLGDATFAARVAAGILVASSTELATHDVAPVVDGLAAPDGAIDIEDVMLLVYRAAGRDPTMPGDPSATPR